MTWESGMGVDPVAYGTLGFYTETYGVGEEGNVANLFASLGMLEDAPDAVYVPPSIFKSLYQFIFKGVRRWLRR